MELLDCFDRALDEFGSRVHAVDPGRWHHGTPCAEWSVRDLVNHVTGEHLWAPVLLSGATLEEVGDRFDGDVLDDDPVGTWDRAAHASKEAFHRPGALDRPVHTSGGPVPAGDYARQMISDLTVHAWDLARGAGVDDRLDPELVSEVHAYTAPRAASWRGAGLFGPPVEVPRTAPLQDRLVAMLGRRP
ncbi:TIGR03086 family metal-binding protein [Streptomyces sodiiphilus]|uniref:TIGR03086 family metal-binding protein n=1 Tax=Streptomyces sodiiphilus TaxID=226217 RepID=A0ABN2P1Z5_9ACTN